MVVSSGPEVPEDRDPAQREAEGPRASMDYSEFPLLDFLSTKKKTETRAIGRLYAIRIFADNAQTHGSEVSGVNRRIAKAS